MVPLQTFLLFVGCCELHCVRQFLKNIIAVLRLDVPHTMAAKQQGFPLWFWHCRCFFDITIVHVKVHDICQWIFIARVIRRWKRKLRVSEQKPNMFELLQRAWATYLKGSVGRRSERPSNAWKQVAWCLSVASSCHPKHCDKQRVARCAPTERCHKATLEQRKHRMPYATAPFLVLF